MGDAGWDCVGLTLKLFDGGSRCCSLEDVNDARAVADRLGMPHYVLNYTERFSRDVIGRFIAGYERGETPNPCIDCNRYIKWKGLLERLGQLGFDCLASGHYARTGQSGGRRLLKKGRDLQKDQSYVLYGLSQEELARTRFPLGDLTKAQVREIAAGRGFINAKKDESQDICFVPDGDYGSFMERYTGRSYPPGDILGLDGAVLGRHRGQLRYTIGQRRGLGVAGNVPLYVAAKDPAANTLTLGPGSSLYSRSLTARDLNLIACDSLEGPLRVAVKTRYLQREQQATAVQTGEDSLRVDFDEPQRAVTAGQAVVLYDGDTVIGGGTLATAF
jgi:tRNA-specific 2-thiouridylase